MGFNQPCVFLVLVSPVISGCVSPVISSCLPCDIFGVDHLLINDLPRENEINKCKKKTDDRLCPRLMRRAFLTIVYFTVEATSSLDFGDFVCLTTSLGML
jgi:hypothetical protein